MRGRDIWHSSNNNGSINQVTMLGGNPIFIVFEDKTD
jgi:hypothetical protein